MRAFSFGSGSLLAAAAGLLTSLGAAAVDPVTPGQIGDTLKRPVPLQPVQPTPSVQAQPQEAPPGAASSKTVLIQRFEFAGNTLFTGEQLSALVRDYLNRPVTLLEIFEAADRVADYYVARGYTLASVNVPPQKVEGGTIRLLVSEGRIGRIVTEDNALYTREQITDYLGEVQPGTVYQGSALSERVRQLNTLPGLQAKAIVKPGEGYGTSDLIVKTVEDPVSGAMIVDNFGRESVGEIRVSAFGQLNNPFKVGDQLQLLLLRSEDDLLRYGYVAYGLPVNVTGTRLNLSYGRADFDVAGATPVSGVNHSGRIMLNHPLLVGMNDRLALGAGTSRIYTNADINGLPISATSITLLELEATYTHSHPNLAVTQLVTNLSTNFDELERADLDRVAGNGETLSAGQRARLELDLQHVYPLADNLQLYLHANGVYSPDPLSDVTQFSLGGPNSVRGYPAAEARGDRGYFGSVSLNRPVAVGGLRVVGRVFADAGRVFGVDGSTLLTRPEDKTLSSVGVGADFQYERISAKLDWAFPREERTSSDGRDDRLFGSLAVAF